MNEPADRSNSRKSVAGWWLLLPAMLPLAAAGVANGSRDLPLVPSTKPAPLTFASRLYTHGDQPVEVTSVIQSEFRFRNDGNQPIEIGEVQTSCDCMRPRISHKVLQPGEIGSLVVPIETLLQSPGAHEYDLFLNYEADVSHRVPLRIKAIIPERTVVVQPKQLFISQRSDRAADFQVTINDYRERPFNVTAVQSSSAWIAGELRSTREPVIQQVGHSDGSDSGASAEAVTIEGSVAGHLPAGRHFFLLSVATDDPEFQVITVPVVVNGPPFAGPPELAPSVKPKEIHLFTAQIAHTPPTAQARMLLPADWDVSHVTAWPEQLDVTFEEPVQQSKQQQAVLLKVRLDEVPPKGISDGVIQLHANEDRDLVTLRVRFYRP